MPLVVYKLGGSLLTLPDLESRLAGLFKLPLPPSIGVTSTQPSTRAVLVGGGRAADVVREWDKRFRLGDEPSHELAVAAMGLNARLVYSLMPESKWATKKSSLGEPRSADRIAVLDPAAVLAEAERRDADRLPRSWDVTSDSLAAYLAIQWNADALVLVKSTRRPVGKNVRDAAKNGLVDRHFSQLAHRVSCVAWVNLRSRRPTIDRWL